MANEILKLLILISVLFLSISFLFIFPLACHNCLQYIKWMGGILLGMLVGFIFVGMFAAIFGWYNAYFFGFFGIVLFSLFVVYDTQIIRDEFSDDMWLFGGVMLYVDFVNLFIQLLSILGNAQRS